MVPQQQRRRRRRAALVRTSERRVVVVRGPGGFGFTIAGQRPCVVSAVAEDGPAERAGLRAGDALLGVDGASVARAPHTSVARLIAAAPGAISLSVAPRESPPTDTEDTEPDERARTRRRHPPPRRRPQPAMLHHPACHSAGTSAVNEILQNLSRAQLSPNQVARLECRAVVAYLGTIETPQASANAAPGHVRTAVRKLRQERRPAAPILLCVLPNSLLLRRPSSQALAQYPRERIVYVGCGSEADRRYFGLVTFAEPTDLECTASHSCHVFAVDSRMAEHEAHVIRAREFQIACTRDPVAERCLEFPPSAEYVVGVIRGMYSLPADDCSSPILQQISKLAVKGDSPVIGNFARGRPVFRPRDRRQCRQDEIEGQEFVANSPQPSNHSEITTTSSNSDSGIGFNNDCRNIADRILVVEFANQQPPVNRFRQDMPRRPAGLVGCVNFDADGSFLSNTTPVVDGFGGQGRPLNLDDVILTNDLQTVRPVRPRTEQDSYNYNNVYSNMPSSSRGFPNGAVYDQVYTENECHHYELIPPPLDLDSDMVDTPSETFNSVEIYEERRQEYQSNESVENVTVISGGTSKASMDSVSVYSSRSHEEARPCLRRHLQASLDDMLLGRRPGPEGREKDDEHQFVHPSSVKFKIRKSKPLNLITRTRNMFGGKSRRSLSASAGDVTADCDVIADIVAANSEPDLRDSQSEQSSPFRRWTTSGGAGSSCRHPDHRNMYNKQSAACEDTAAVSAGSEGGGGGGGGGPARWALGLEHLLADPPGARAFAHFLQQEYAAENIRFWWACEQYSLACAAARSTLAHEIFSRHLSDAAPEPVNVDCGARRAAAQSLRAEPPPADLFLQAQKQIFNVLKLDSYPRFLRSAVHADCARAALRGAAAPYGGESEGTKLKKSASNASDRRRSGGASLLPWKLRTSSKDRNQTADHGQGNISDVLKGAGAATSLCRVLLPDGATSVVGVGPPPPGASGAPGTPGAPGAGNVKSLVDRLLARRNLSHSAYDVLLSDVRPGESPCVPLSAPAGTLAGREVRVQPRAVLRLQLRDKCVLLRCRAARRLRHILPPVLARYGLPPTSRALRPGGEPVASDTLMQELDGCRLMIVEVSESGDYREPNLVPCGDDADDMTELALRAPDNVVELQSNSSAHSSNRSIASSTAGSNGTAAGSNGTGAGSNGTAGRVRATLRPGPLHHHPPEFLENLRETQRQRLQGPRRSPPPLPPKPGPKLQQAIV